MEVAASLRARGLEVHVVAPETVPFERTLGPELGGLLRAVHEEHGVRFHLGQTVAVGRARRGHACRAATSALTADLVVLGVGVKPRSSWRSAAGLEVDRGVVVDDRLRTSVAGVFAAGDVARYPYAPTGEQVRIEHWAVAQRMGRVAALNILGGDLPVHGAAVLLDHPIRRHAVVRRPRRELGPHRRRTATWRARDATLAYRRGGQTLAVATRGPRRTSLEAEVAIEAGDQATLAAFGRTR